MANNKIVKLVVVLATYRFKHIARICFSVLASNKADKYTVCFTEQGASCSCASRVDCYHIKQLRPIAEKYFASRNGLATYDVQAAATQVLADAEIGDAYEHMPKVLVSYTFSDHCRYCGGNHNSNECPY